MSSLLLPPAVSSFFPVAAVLGVAIAAALLFVSIGWMNARWRKPGSHAPSMPPHHLPADPTGSTTSEEKSK